MQFKDIFAEFYTQFRGDSTIPDKTDPEWAIAAAYGNTAIRRWANVEGEKWEQLWTTAKADGTNLTFTSTETTTPNITTYACPDDMKMPGGYVKVTNPKNAGDFYEIRVLQQPQVQYEVGSSPYAYFTGDSQNGFTLNLNLSNSSNVGYNIDFPYYKKPTYFNTTAGTVPGTILEDGTTVTECPDASFIINYILAYRFRSTRNFPAYQTAKADAEEALKGMQIKNGMGTNGNTFNLHQVGDGIFGR